MLLENRKGRSPIELPLDRFNTVDLALNNALAPLL